MSPKLLYLDVDGVLLGKHSPHSTAVVLANHAHQFLEFCLPRFECHWLTTHCKDGNATAVLELLSRYTDEAVMRLVKQIRPTCWKTLKTEVIHFGSDFYWIDDQLLWTEVEILKQNNVLGRWIQIDTRRNPDDLNRAISLLKLAQPA